MNHGVKADPKSSLGYGCDKSVAAMLPETSRSSRISIRVPSPGYWKRIRVPLMSGTVSTS